ncbi:MAG: DUF2335 domain-containing protein [Actinomycetota bacterium]
MPKDSDDPTKRGDSSTQDQSSSESDQAEIEVLEGEIEETAERVATRAVEHIVAEEWWVGVLPHPKHLEVYERILPGLANRIVQMAENEQKHRQGLESRAMGLEETLGKRGQFLAFGVVISALVVALVLGLAEQPVAASIVAGAGLSGLVGLFLKRHRTEAEETEGGPSFPFPRRKKKEGDQGAKELPAAKDSPDGQAAGGTDPGNTG